MADAILDDEDPLEVPGPGFNQVQEVIIRHASDNTYQMQLIPKSLAMIIAARSPMRSAVDMAVPRPSGRTVLPNAFGTILTKGTAVSETKEFSKSFITEVVDRSACNMITTEVICYREPGMFSTLCNVHADTSKVARTISPRRGYAGLQFYRQEFSIILMFGLTELQAQLCWKEDGIERRSPAAVVFDQVVEAA
ncbi:hypothetical protein C8R48DRAFT_768032 [Suillus tomentosus]|nr:hypothetical protein C8R48DRAFT_768032 [Suillus tomentosus]